MFACETAPGAPPDTADVFVTARPSRGSMRLSRRNSRAARLGATAGVFAAGAGGSVEPRPAARGRPVGLRQPPRFRRPVGRLARRAQGRGRGKAIRAVLPAETPLGEGVEVVDCGGRVLMPGLIDAHWHAMMAPIPLEALLTADVGYITLVAAAEAERTLMRGFTSVRDMAGPTFSLKRAIDGGHVRGPRIWPSGAMISQTGGHGDFRFPYEIPSAPGAALSRGDAVGGGAIADGADRVLMRAREQLMLGASQLKLAAGGGVASNYDPIDVSQYTGPEFRAAVEAAENWGTYVAVHAYTPRAIKTAIRAGVRCIEHGHLMDEPTAELIAENDVWLSTQPFLDNEFAAPLTNPGGQEKMRQVFAGTDAAYRFAKAHDLKTAWGTDIVFAPEMTKHQGAMLTTLIAVVPARRNLEDGDQRQRRAVWRCRGPRNPYPGQARRDRRGRARRPRPGRRRSDCRSSG